MNNKQVAKILLTERCEKYEVIRMLQKKHQVAKLVNGPQRICGDQRAKFNSSRC